MTIEENFVFPVYIHDDTIKKIIIYCKKSKNEIFGYLLGNILQWDDKIYVKIEEILFLLGAIHSEQFSTAQIEGAAGKYESKFQRLKRKTENSSLRVVGWWHSHPNFGVFLSATDLKTQEYFFPEAYQVAVVVDPIRDELGFYTLDRNTKQGYRPINYAVITTNEKTL